VAGESRTVVRRGLAALDAAQALLQALERLTAACERLVEVVDTDGNHYVAGRPHGDAAAPPSGYVVVSLPRLDWDHGFVPVVRACRAMLSTGADR